jgi:cation diffusion facilitator family transporter
MDAKSSRTAVYAALIGNALIAATKAVAAAWTGSSALLSEAIHSLVDTGNEVLLLYGMRRAARRPDPGHPLGYGRELYFWSFVVALLIFALGGGISIYEGIMHVSRPEPIRNVAVNYVVLGLAFLFETASWVISLRQFRATKGNLRFYQAFLRSKDPASFMVLFEDSAALIGILIACLGIFVATSFDMPVFDGIASILIGLLLTAIAVLLARESKSLLIGEGADRELAESILRIAARQPGIEDANGVLTIQLAPDQILSALSIEFADALRADDVEAAVRELERKVRAAHPDVVALFVKPQAGGSFREALHDRFGISADPSAGGVVDGEASPEDMKK